MKKIAVIYMFVVAVYFFSAFSHGLIDPDEPRYAATAKNMTLTGDYIVPYFNGKLRINKPPLTYWLISACYKFFHINEFASRLPHIIFSLLLILGALFFLSQFLSLTELAVFICVLSSSPLFFYLARYCNTDMILTFFFSFSILFFYNYLESEKKIYLVLFYLSYLFANLAKGPVAYLIVFIIIIFVILKKEKRILKNYKFWIIILLLSLSPLAYLYIVSLKTGGFGLTELIARETTGRFLKGYRHPEPFYFYAEFFLLLFLPWSLFFLLNILEIKNLWKENDFNKLNIIWFFFVLIFFSISKSKLISYILPMSFPFAYITARIIGKKQYSVKNKYILFLAGFIICGIIGFVIFNGYALPDYKVIIGYLILLCFGVWFVSIEKNSAISLGFVNLLLFLSIFVFGADFINNNKSEKILETVKGKYLVASYRRNLTGTAFYYGNYFPADTIEEIRENLGGKDKKILIVSYKTDFKRIKDKIEFRKIAETRRMIAVEFDYKR